MSTKNLSEYNTGEDLDGGSFTIAIAVSDWNDEITHALLAGCRDTLLKHGVKEANLYVAHVPGSFELPAAARMLDDRYSPDAVICLGCVIQGETRHNEYINQAVATGLVQLSVLRSKPFIFGVLTPNNQDQAKDRAGGQHGNKGIEAAVTALRMAGLKQHLKENVTKIGFK